MPLSLILIIMYCLGLSRRGIRAACAARLPFLPMATFPALIKTSTREKPCQRSTGKKSDSCSALPNYRYLASISFLFPCLFLIYLTVPFELYKQPLVCHTRKKRRTRRQRQLGKDGKGHSSVQRRQRQGRQGGSDSRQGPDRCKR